MSTDYNRLEEAVNAILCDSDSEAEYDFAVIPPEPSVLTDEEEGSDEDMLFVSLPKDVPGNIEVFSCNSDDYDSSDDEPVAEKAKRMPRQQPNQPIWR